MWKASKKEETEGADEVAERVSETGEGAATEVAGEAEEEAAEEGSVNGGDEAVWVQCEKCEKWRRLPVGCSAPDEETPWYCEMNGDETRNHCDADEDPMPADDEEEEALEAESIRARRETSEEGGEETFLVRWKGCTWEDDTWVPRSEIDEDIVSRFLAKEEARKRSAPPEAPPRPAGKGKKKGASFVRF